MLLRSPSLFLALIRPITPSHHPFEHLTRHLVHLCGRTVDFCIIIIVPIAGPFKDILRRGAFWLLAVLFLLVLVVPLVIMRSGSAAKCKRI